MVATTTVVASQTAIFGSVNQNVKLSAIVTANAGAGPVNQGTVTFAVFQGTTQIGASVTSATVLSGNAFVTYVLPGTTVPGVYTIVATYNPSPNYFTSTNKNNLTVSKASTATVAADQMATYNDVDQNVTLSAVVTATAGAGLVNEGTVTFKVFQGSTQIGSSVTSTTVIGGAAPVTFVLPANTVVGTYVIVASYNPTPDYIGSIDSTHTLLVHAGPANDIIVSTQAPSAATAGAPFAVVIQAEDAFNNLATSFNGNVTISFSTDPSQGTAPLNGTTTVTAENWIASFQLSVHKALADDCLSAKSGHVPGVSRPPLPRYRQRLRRWCSRFSGRDSIIVGSPF